MKANKLTFSLRTGAAFGLPAGVAYLLLPQAQPLFATLGLPDGWAVLSRFFAVAALTWSAFLFYDHRHPMMPGRFIYHLFTGLALTFVSSITAALVSYLTIKASLPATLDTGHFVIGIYSLSFLTAFVITITLATISCIRECSMLGFTSDREFV